MSAWLTIIVNGTLVVMIGLLPIAFYRVAKPKLTAADRLVGVDLITNLLVGIAVILAVVEGTSVTLDIGVGLAALSFAGTVSIARYISEGRVF